MVLVYGIHQDPEKSDAPEFWDAGGRLHLNDCITLHRVLVYPIHQDPEKSDAITKMKSPTRIQPPPPPPPPQPRKSI